MTKQCGQNGYGIESLQRLHQQRVSKPPCHLQTRDEAADYKEACLHTDAQTMELSTPGTIGLSQWKTQAKIP